MLCTGFYSTQTRYTKQPRKKEEEPDKTMMRILVQIIHRNLRMIDFSVLVYQTRDSSRKDSVF